MEIKEFIEKFAECFDDTDADVFTPETKFRELEEWSSMTVLSVIAMIGDEYDVPMMGHDIRECETIQDLFEKVKSKM